MQAIARAWPVARRGADLSLSAKFFRTAGYRLAHDLVAVNVEGPAPNAGQSQFRRQNASRLLSRRAPESFGTNWKYQPPKG